MSFFSSLIGTARLRFCATAAPWSRPLRLAVATPMTFPPHVLNTGPPELPDPMGAENWIQARFS